MEIKIQSIWKVSMKQPVNLSLLWATTLYLLRKDGCRQNDIRQSTLRSIGVTDVITLLLAIVNEYRRTKPES